MHDRHSIGKDMLTYLAEGDEGAYSFIEVDRPPPMVIEERRKAETRTSGRIAVAALSVMTVAGASAFINWIRDHPITAASIAAITISIVYGAWRLIRSIG